MKSMPVKMRSNTFTRKRAQELGHFIFRAIDEAHENNLRVLTIKLYYQSGSTDDEDVIGVRIDSEDRNARPYTP